MASFLKAIANWFRGKKDSAAEALSDPIRDGKFAIEDSEKRVAQFRMKVAKFMAVNKQLAREIDRTRADVNKWTSIAKKAAAAGNKKDVTEAVQAKQRAEVVLQEKQKQFDKNEQILEHLRRQVQLAVTKVAKAKANYSQLVARHEGAQVRKELAEAATDFGQSGPLAELDDLQKAVDEQETEAEAIEEMVEVATGPASLEDKYSSTGEASVDAEVERLMAEAGA